MNNIAIGFGGGCHWCTEGVFAALYGVDQLTQGFITSHEPHDSFSEAVKVSFQPELIPLEALIEVHLRTHTSTSNHKMRGKYRSAIYTTSEAQAEQTRHHLSELQSDFEEPLVTQVLPLVAFKPSDEKFQRYFEKNAGGAFCQRYIDPKLALLTAEYNDLMRSES